MIEAEAYACVTIPALSSSLEYDQTPAVRSNCAWSIGQLCRAIPVNDVVYQLGLQALMNALQDKDFGVKEDAKAALLHLDDVKGLQMIENLESGVEI